MKYFSVALLAVLLLSCGSRESVLCAHAAVKPGMTVVDVVGASFNCQPADRYVLISPTPCPSFQVSRWRGKSEMRIYGSGRGSDCPYPGPYEQLDFPDDASLLGALAEQAVVLPVVSSLDVWLTQDMFLDAGNSFQVKFDEDGKVISRGPIKFSDF